jgi:hypothetical protein
MSYHLGLWDEGINDAYTIFLLISEVVRNPFAMAGWLKFGRLIERNHSAK